MHKPADSIFRIAEEQSLLLRGQSADKSRILRIERGADALLKRRRKPSILEQPVYRRFY